MALLGVSTGLLLLWLLGLFCAAVVLMGLVTPAEFRFLLPDLDAAVAGLSQFDGFRGGDGPLGLVRHGCCWTDVEEMAPEADGRCGCQYSCRLERRERAGLFENRV